MKPYIIKITLNVFLIQIKVKVVILTKQSYLKNEEGQDVVPTHDIKGGLFCKHPAEYHTALDFY